MLDEGIKMFSFTWIWEIQSKIVHNQFNPNYTV